MHVNPVYRSELTPGEPRRGSFHDRAVLLVLALFVTSASLGCASTTYLSVRKTPKNPMTVPLQLLARSGPKPTSRTERLLRRFDLETTQSDDPMTALTKLQETLIAEPTSDKMYAFAELAYIQGKRALSHGDSSLAMDMYSAAVAHAYLYLFAPQLETTRNYYDPQFRRACDLYNASLEDLLRIIDDEGRLKPGETFTIQRGSQRFEVQVVLRGLWRPDVFEEFEFVSDYEVEGLVNRHVTYGLGVPLIAVRSPHASQDPASQFYPRKLSFPVTAVLRAAQTPCRDHDTTRLVSCVLELHDPLASDRIQIANRQVPLETDLTTPLGYFLDNPEFKGTDIATWGLLNPNRAAELQGLYMLEAYDPNKIPVLMVHGLWSSPETWTEMVNELRSLPEIRDRYQFWTYLYPTGQPFWVSAAQLRDDLENARQVIDPQRHWPTLDQMVVVGHSMGGLVSRLQTLDSGDDFWHLVSDRPFDELQTDDETRQQLARTLFFEPNPSVRRVITLGTPHRGSSFANDYTRWLSRQFIELPATLMQTRMQVARDNPGFFRNTELLKIKTSIDSLAPESPILPAMLVADKASWVRYHNIVGVISKKSFLGRISESGDGLVPFESAHLEDVESEIVVDADHVNVHQHPRSILEVRRILLLHSNDMYAERANHATIPANYDMPLPLPPVGDQAAASVPSPTSASHQISDLPGIRQPPVYGPQAYTNPALPVIAP